MLIEVNPDSIASITLKHITNDPLIKCGMGAPLSVCIHPVQKINFDVKDGNVSFCGLHCMPLTPNPHSSLLAQTTYTNLNWAT